MNPKELDAREKTIEDECEEIVVIEGQSDWCGAPAVSRYTPSSLVCGKCLLNRYRRAVIDRNFMRKDLERSERFLEMLTKCINEAGLPLHHDKEKP